jgi:hypothetical protein
MDMLDDIAAYLTIAPLAVTLAIGLAAAVWYAGSRLALVRVRARPEARPRR